jgi:ribose transport system substrate-binding protein
VPRTDRGASPPGHATSVSSSGARPLVAGLGPHGERPSSPELLGLSPDMLEMAQARAFRVAIVLHTTASDWAKRQVAGIEVGLRRAGAVVVDIVDCGYDAATQVAAIERLVESKPDAVISIPVGSTAVAETFCKLARAEIKLVLLDHAPSGLLPETDYVSVISSDNFGLGQIAASLLSPHIPRNGSICIVAYNIDFFATAQREIAFNKWMRRERPDITLTQVKFEVPGNAGNMVGPYLDGHPNLDGLFVVWDEPAVASLPAIEGRSRYPVMTTVDLGKAIAKALFEGRIVKGVAAQRPFEQGEIAAAATIVALTGNAVPPWIVLPGLAVTADNVVDAYRRVGGAPASSELMAFRGKL